MIFPFIFAHLLIVFSFNLHGFFLPVNVSFMMLLTFQFYIIDIYFIPTVVCVFALLL